MPRNNTGSGRAMTTKLNPGKPDGGETPECDGYPKCDGDLPGEPHEPTCPAAPQPSAEATEPIEHCALCGFSYHIHGQDDACPIVTDYSIVGRRKDSKFQPCPSEECPRCELVRADCICPTKSKPSSKTAPCSCRSADECPHKLDTVSQEEINECVRESMRACGQVPKSERPAPSGETRGTCELCAHSLEGNNHGFDQNDAEIDGDRLVHYGRCTYCKICNPRKPLASEATTKPRLTCKEFSDFVMGEATTKEPDFKQALRELLGLCEEDKMWTETLAKYRSMLDAVAPGEAVGRETRDTVIEILKNCAADYCHPQTRNPENPQWRIDCAIANGVKILESELSTLRRERDQLKAKLQQYTGDYGDSKLASGSTQCTLCLEGK